MPLPDLFLLQPIAFTVLYILAIILIFFSLPYIGRLIKRLFIWWVTRKIAKQTRNMYGDFFGAAGGSPFSSSQSENNDRSGRSSSTSSSYNYQSASGSRSGRRRGKRIDSSVGEYVDYEEIAVDQTSAASDAQSYDSESFARESQVVDVEGEDIR